MTVHSRHIIKSTQQVPQACIILYGLYFYLIPSFNKRSFISISWKQTHDPLWIFNKKLKNWIVTSTCTCIMEWETRRRKSQLEGGGWLGEKYWE